MEDVGRARWGLSIALGGELAEPAVVVELAAIAEAAGWDGVFVWDHLWHRDGAPFADAWVTLAAMATATTTIVLGPLVTPLSRRRPQVVAQQATTLDRLSGGRLVLGLGLGRDGYGELSSFGEPDAGDDRARAARLDAALELLLPALAGEPVPAAGGRRTTVASRRRPRCPVWIAAEVGRPAGLRRAVRHGLDGVAVVGGGEWHPPHVTAVCDVIDRLRIRGSDADGGLAPGPPGRQPSDGTAADTGAAMDVALVGGSFAAPDDLAAAGATWLVPEILPGTTAAGARAVAAAGPRG